MPQSVEHQVHGRLELLRYFTLPATHPKNFGTVSMDRRQTMKTQTSNATLLRPALMSVLVIAILITCEALAQDGSTATSPVANPTLSPAASGSTGKPGGIPTDPLGIANAMGRPFTAAFILASVIGVWSVIERLVMLRRRRVIPRAFVDRFLMHLRAGRMDRAEAISICQQNESPMADVFMHGVRKWGRPSVEVEQAVLDGGERQVSQLRKGLRVLNGVSTLSPLIGLLGTVVGMIRSFNDIATAGAMGQTETLANGIALALLTTAVGLLIAIPAMAAYLYLAGRVDSIVTEMDRLGQELVNLISAEALRDRAIIVPTSLSPDPGGSRERKTVS